MGRRVFTEGEADVIRRLLREKGVADRDRQKSIRGKLRRSLDFYVSDFAHDVEGFTAADFDELVSRGTIEISSSVPTEASVVKQQSLPGSETTRVKLPDALSPGLRVVFCGTAAGATSARVGGYYAGPGNQFWSVLVRVGLTPRLLSPTEFAELSKYGIGLTDLAKFEAGTDSQLTPNAFDTEGLMLRIEAAAPRILAFNGKRAAETVLARAVGYGVQPEKIKETAIFVLPSTSGAARGYWDESVWQDMAEHVRRAEGAR